ncbi:MAG: hypothetical protein A2Y62_07965 [Candidatus Fischerbacteria bacterium RBG_13_37_8]|uniref:Outer membrane protein beta-barrel domain-containing protein n=1 Tax=Candidatus Fischerbacteria bacterium RBG_13_37_8 TaxID=1817863 RepID=A0A1F5V5P1_9BACT|nr:MAG: hypothetical protein A2Y62_07965 [Candidatus Fischerbacteria bacterium RBG_13_37_8]
MKQILIICFFVVSFAVGAVAEDGFFNRPILNNISMPTGYTLKQNEFAIGLGSIGFGITDNIQVETNVLLYLFQIYNGNVKGNLFKSDSNALAVGVDLMHLNLDIFDEETGATVISPYIAYSTIVSDKLFLHLSGQYSHFSAGIDTDDVETSFFTRGTSFNTGLEYCLSNRTKFLTEAGYDATFNGMRFGGAVLFGWDAFRLKLGVQYYNPEGSGGYTMPVIGLWWRFNG